MEYIFIDQENVSLRAIPDHDRIKALFIFAGENQKNFSFEMLESVGKLGNKAKPVRMQGSGNNALDFHIAYYVGKYAEIDPKGKFRIVSKDKGFDPLIKHLLDAGIDCKRVETLSTKVVSKKDVEEMRDDFGEHFRGMSEKARPKRAPKLKAYIKTRYREEDAIVDEVFEALAASGLFTLEGSKISYRDADPATRIGPAAPLRPTTRAGSAQPG